MRAAMVLGVILSCFLIDIVNADLINPASHQQTEIVTQAIEDPITVINSVALKSSRHPNSYYVGLRFVAHDLEMQGIGIWLVEGDRSRPNVVYSVNATAIVFSRYPKAHRLENPARISDHEAKLILNYLEAE